MKLGFLPNKGGVLTQKGLFFKRQGDLIQAFEILSKNRIASKVMDTKTAVMYEEVQKHRVLYEPYYQRIDPDKVVASMVKQNTLAKLESYSYSKAMRRSDSWEVILKMEVTGSIFKHLTDVYGEKEANKRIKVSRREFIRVGDPIQGDYNYLFGLFFLTEKDLEQAKVILTEMDQLQVDCLEVDDALTSFHLQQLIKGRDITIPNILETAKKMNKGRSFWKSSLTSFTKSFIIKEIDSILKVKPNRS